MRQTYTHAPARPDETRRERIRQQITEYTQNVCVKILNMYSFIATQRALLNSLLGFVLDEGTRFFCFDAFRTRWQELR